MFCPTVKKGDKVVITKEWAPDLENWTLGGIYTIVDADEPSGSASFQNIVIIDNHGIRRKCGNMGLKLVEDDPPLPDWF